MNLCEYRSRVVPVFISFACLIVMGFQCEECFEGDYRLEGTRPWLPLKGKTQLNFVDARGAVSTFKIKVIDTLQTYQNAECASQYRSEYIQVSVYLNTPLTDSIFIQLGPPSDISVHAISGDTLYMSTGRFFNSPSSEVVSRLENYRVGGRTYPDVRLFKANEGNDKSTDSVTVAKGFGLVAFKYKGKNYLLN